MAFFNTALLCGAFVFLALHEGLGIRGPPRPPHPPCPAECPVITVTGNVTDPDIRKSYEGNISARIWATGAVVPQTPLLTQLRDIMLEMSACDSVYFSHFVFMHALWSAALFASPNLYISMCPFAALINETMAYDKTQNESTFVDTFYGVSGTIFDTCNLLSYASLTQTGCADLADPVQFPQNCYENGLAFDANEAWNLYGNLTRPILTDVFFKLYDSEVFLERAHATLLAFILIPAQFKLFVDHPPAINFETAEYFVLSPAVPRCCCACTKSRLDDLCVLHNETIYTNATAAVAIIIEAKSEL